MSDYTSYQTPLERFREVFGPDEPPTVLVDATEAEIRARRWANTSLELRAKAEVELVRRYSAGEVLAAGLQDPGNPRATVAKLQKMFEDGSDIAPRRAKIEMAFNLLVSQLEPLLVGMPPADD